MKFLKKYFQYRTIPLVKSTFRGLLRLRKNADFTLNFAISILLLILTIFKTVSRYFAGLPIPLRYFWVGEGMGNSVCLKFLLIFLQLIICSFSATTK